MIVRSLLFINRNSVVQIRQSYTGRCRRRRGRRWQAGFT